MLGSSADVLGGVALFSHVAHFLGLASHRVQLQ
jgi:hypothetical protein